MSYRGLKLSPPNNSYYSYSDSSSSEPSSSAGVVLDSSEVDSSVLSSPLAFSSSGSSGPWNIYFTSFPIHVDKYVRITTYGESIHYDRLCLMYCIHKLSSSFRMLYWKSTIHIPYVCKKVNY